jgi:hypothetical protein
MKQVSLDVFANEQLFCIENFCLDKGRTRGGLMAPLLTASLNYFGSTTTGTVHANHYATALETNGNNNIL